MVRIKVCQYDMPHICTLETQVAYLVHRCFRMRKTWAAQKPKRRTDTFGTVYIPRPEATINQNQSVIRLDEQAMTHHGLQPSRLCEATASCWTKRAAI